MWIPDADWRLSGQCSRRSRNHTIAIGTFILKTDTATSFTPENLQFKATDTFVGELMAKRVSFLKQKKIQKRVAFVAKRKRVSFKATVPSKRRERVTFYSTRKRRT